MSENHSKAYSRNYLSTLSVEQLKDILREDLLSDSIDLDLVEYVNSLLDEKAPLDVELDVNDSWERFKANLNSAPLYSTESACNEPASSQRTAKHIRPLVRIAVIAAVITALLLGSTVAASAFGFDLWGSLKRWTSEVFGFETAPDALYSLEYNNMFAELKDTLTELGIVSNVVPNYLPDGYEQTEFQAQEFESTSIICCKYSYGSSAIIFQYVINSQMPIMAYSKDEVEPEIYESDGIEYSIVSNDGKYAAIWIADNVQCSITGVSEKDELLNIIKSIYGG